MSLSGATLQETMVEFAEQHVVAAHGRAPTTRLPIASKNGYGSLARLLGDPRPRSLDYDDVAGAAGLVIDRLRPGYADNKFWHRFVQQPFPTRPDAAWDALLPLEASLKPRIQFEPGEGTACKFSLKPRVLIYPWGWSAWLSLRITGAHTLEDLAELLNHLSSEPCIRTDGSPAARSTEQYLAHVAEGVRVDVFSGLATRDQPAGDALSVVTVIAKQGAGPSLGALSAADQQLLLRLVRSESRPSSHPFAEHVHELIPDDPLQYALVDGRRCFLWVQSLLGSRDPRDHDHLRCYHNNTFRSLERAGQLAALVAAADQPRASTRFAELVEAARGELARPRYRGRLVIDLYCV